MNKMRHAMNAVDEKYLEEASKRALQLLAMRGFVMNQGTPQNVAVDRLRRIMTLCVRAQSELKTFAAAAFYDKPDYYNSNYASVNRRPADEAGDVEIEDPVEEEGSVTK
jgi:hypothetical protein